MTISLISQIEGAPEGTRSLSDMMLLACQWKGYDPHGAGILISHWTTPEGDSVPTESRPDPTILVQDAISLIPKGWRFTLTQPDLKSFRKADNEAWLYRSDYYSKCTHYSNRCEHKAIGYASTPALAVCSAVLDLFDYTASLK